MPLQLALEAEPARFLAEAAIALDPIPDPTR
jgi:hypothetical protein